MITIYQLKSNFQKLLRPLTNALAKMGMTPNQVTLFALVLSLITGGALALFPSLHFLYLLLPFILLFRMGLNAIDGMLAKEHNQKSRLGVFLNELSDVISDTALYLPFALLPGTFPSLVIGVIILSIITEMTGIINTQIGGTRRYDGPMGKSDRAFVFGLLSILIYFHGGPYPWFNWVWGAVIALLSFSLVNRIRKGLQEFS